MYTCGGWLVVVLKDPPSSCRGRLVEDFEFDRRELVGSSRGKTRDTLGVCDLMLASPGVAACGIPRSRESWAWPPSFSSFCGSTTGSVIVSRNTGRLATSPKSLSKTFLSRQLVKVGKRVATRLCGVGRSAEGHHVGTFVGSSCPKESRGK